METVLANETPLTLDELYHRTRKSERRTSYWIGIAVAFAVAATVLLGCLVYAISAYRTLSSDQLQRAEIRACKDRAFAVVADDAFGSGEYTRGRLLDFYHQCDRDPNAQFESLVKPPKGGN